MDKRYFNASDAISWSICARRAWFDRNLPDGLVVEIDPFDTLMQEKGLEHEATVLATLGAYEQATSVEHTQELMRQQAPLIYQGLLVSDALGVLCQPDFLRLDDGAYRAEDAKFSTTMSGKKDQIAQLGTYDIVLGSKHRARALMADGEVYELSDSDLRTAKRFIDDMGAIAASSQRPEANFVATKCESCPYRPVCRPEFEASENLGLNYFVDNRALPELGKRGIRTLSDMARAEISDLDDVPYLKTVEKRTNAILQAQSYLQKRVIKIGEINTPPGDAVHFDIETWPFGSGGQGSVYLWGFLLPPYDPATCYEYVWADEQDDEQGFLSVLDAIEKYRQRFNELVLVHYSDFERIQIRRLAERYDLVEHPTVRWLLDDPSSCFDIKKSVSSALILPVTGYGLKAICKHPDLVNFQWALKESGSQWSVVRYANYLASNDAVERAAIREELLAYNRDDVTGTLEQQRWMERLASNN